MFIWFIRIDVPVICSKVKWITNYKLYIIIIIIIIITMIIIITSLLLGQYQNALLDIDSCIRLNPIFVKGDCYNNNYFIITSLIIIYYVIIIKAC